VGGARYRAGERQRFLYSRKYFSLMARQPFKQALRLNRQSSEVL